MPKYRRSPQVFTRLAQHDMERFREVALVRGVTVSALLREAVLFYLDHHNRVRVDEFEGIFAQQVKSMKDELKALMKKGFTDIHAVYLFLGRIDENAHEAMQECTNIATKRVSKSLAAEEPAVASSMTKNAIRAS